MKRHPIPYVSRETILLLQGIADKGNVSNAYEEANFGYLHTAITRRSIPCTCSSPYPLPQSFSIQTVLQSHVPYQESQYYPAQE